ncbi:MAG: class I SAM-dependent methyltransferase [bacterium]|nr:class I SAM-dependent methyltransferase [bacterium]
MKKSAAIKRYLQPLLHTPLHPQWLTSTGGHHLLEALGKISPGALVLDIGCATQWPRKHLHKDVSYIGLDYYQTATGWYRTQPDIFGSALQLPLDADSADVVLLLDVMEHLENPDTVMSEIHRVLRANGKLLLQVPFLYPLHDEPRDFWRLTIHGLNELGSRHGLKPEVIYPRGTPAETSGLLRNLALGHLALTLLRNRSPFMLMLPFLAAGIVANNIGSWLLSWLEKDSGFMPYSYFVIFRKA